MTSQTKAYEIMVRVHQPFGLFRSLQPGTDSERERRRPDGRDRRPPGRGIARQLNGPLVSREVSPYGWGHLIAELANEGDRIVTGDSHEQGFESEILDDLDELFHDRSGVMR